MKVIFIYGPAAAGKYTIGSILSKNTDIPLFHNHLTVDLVQSLFDFGNPGFVELREQIWLSSFSVAAKLGQSFIFTFNPENTVEPKLIAQLDSIITHSGGSVLYVELICSNKEVLNRIDNDSRKQFGKLVDKDLYSQLVDQGTFEFPKLTDPAIRIDTEQMTAEESSDCIQKTLLEL